MLAIGPIRVFRMRTYRITDSAAGGLRLAVFEDGEEVAGGSAPTRSEEDRAWLEERAFDLEAFEVADEGDADVRST